MDLENIKEILVDREDLLNVEVVKETVFQDNQYQFLIICDLVISQITIPIVIAIPNNWGRNLIDIYIQNSKEFPFIPHVDIKGKICLFELEGILIDQNFYGILSQSLDRASRIIEEGLSGKNKEEFIDEFDSYWMQLPCIQFAKCELPKDNRMSVIKYGDKLISKRKKETYGEYLRRSKNKKIYLSPEPQHLERYYRKDEKILIKNALYIPVEMEDFLFPPDPRFGVSNEYIQCLLEYVDVKRYRSLESKLGNKKLLVFSIQQPNGMVTLLGVILENCEISTENGKCILKSAKRVVPVYIERIDKQYLMARSSGIKNPLAEKKVLLIGCGSVGGYIANELVKAGIENMMLIDPDFLYETNIFRHVLGLEYVNQYKSVALQRYLEKNIPNLKFASLEENIEEAIQEGEIEFDTYDIIISAVGNHNVNRWINEFIHSKEIKTPVVYAWNEVLGIGHHIAYIQYGYKGCYECFFGRNEETEELYDRTSYCEPGQNVVKRVAGCGNTFIPYGSTTSLKTAAMCVDVVKKTFEEQYTDNMIISAQGDDYHFLRAGLKLSNKYLRQSNSIVEYSGNQFADLKCKCCGVKNGSSK